MLVWYVTCHYPLTSQIFSWLVFWLYSTQHCTNNVLFSWGIASKLSRPSVQSTKAGSGDLKPKTQNQRHYDLPYIHVKRPTWISVRTSSLQGGTAMKSTSSSFGSKRECVAKCWFSVARFVVDRRMLVKPSLHHTCLDYQQVRPGRNAAPFFRMRMRPMKSSVIMKMTLKWKHGLCQPKTKVGIIQFSVVYDGYKRAPPQKNDGSDLSHLLIRTIKISH